jgi:hypothetical protein
MISRFIANQTACPGRRLNGPPRRVAHGVNALSSLRLRDWGANVQGTCVIGGKRLWESFGFPKSMVEE